MLCISSVLTILGLLIASLSNSGFETVWIGELSEGYTIDYWLREDRIREEKRWFVENHEWAGESVVSRVEVRVTLDRATTAQPPFKYCPFYCEENVWYLAQAPCFAESERVVAVISNAMMACLFWDQRACVESDFPVWWDYHVVLLVRRDGWQVYDLDTRLPCPSDASTWLRQTFQFQERMPERIRPRFLLFGGDVYVSDFSSDGSHMRDEEGRWQSPPPAWPPIDQGTGVGFHAFIERHLRTGSISLDEMHVRFD